MTTAQELREVASLYDEETDLHPLLIGAATRIEQMTAQAEMAITAKAHAIQQAQIWKMEALAQQAIVKDRDALIEQYKADAERLKAAGSPMANTMFNLAQTDDKHADAFKQMQISWDAAMKGQS